jgi:hypothetical protein
LNKRRTREDVCRSTVARTAHLPPGPVRPCQRASLWRHRGTLAQAIATACARGSNVRSPAPARAVGRASRASCRARARRAGRRRGGRLLRRIRKPRSSASKPTCPGAASSITSKNVYRPHISRYVLACLCDHHRFRGDPDDVGAEPLVRSQPGVAPEAQSGFARPWESCSPFPRCLLSCSWGAPSSTTKTT